MKMARLIGKKRWAWIQLLTFMYNTCNVALYFESANAFGEHYGIIDHRLSDNRAGWGLILLIFILALTIILGFTNHESYFHHIDEALSKINQENRVIKPVLLQERKDYPKSQKQLILIPAFISSLFKTGVGSTSFAALLHSQTNSLLAIVISAFCAPGNFLAQFAIFAHFLKTDPRYLSTKQRKYLIKLLTLCYNLSNTALYFNAADAFPYSMKWLDHRISEGSVLGEYFLCIMMIIGSFFLFTSTQRSYSKRIAKIFNTEKRDAENRYFHKKYCHKNSLNYWLSLVFSRESEVATLYKGIINSISLIVTLNSFSIPLSVCIMFSLFCVPGNIVAPFAILKTEKQTPNNSTTSYKEEINLICYRIFKPNKIIKLHPIKGLSETTLGTLMKYP